jgi:quercetin dioxygenase-like cupin family protein
MEAAVVNMVGEQGEVEPRVHEGQEFMFVLEGRIKLTLGSRVFDLEKGHAAYWNADIPHKAVRIGKKTARSLHVYLVPGRWSGLFQNGDNASKNS